MKRYLCSLLLCIALPASAGTLFTLTNKAGGLIQFTDTKCPNDTGQGIVYTAGEGGRIGVYGCWSFDDEQVIVRWSDGDTYVYANDVLELTDYGVEVAKSRKASREAPKTSL